MSDLKNRLRDDLSHVEKVYFDADGNWYLHKNPSCISEMTSKEILSEESETGPEQEPKRNKKRFQN